MNRFTDVDGLHVTRSENRNGPSNGFQIVDELNRLVFRFSSWASEASSMAQGKLVVFTRPLITGPASAKHARSTGFFVFNRNSFTIACKLG